MNESLDKKISIVKGTVTQAGYEQAICTFIKADENRKDSFSDKPMYILDDINISDSMYAVTPSVTEALNRSPRRSVGIMNDNGELIVPIINSDVVKLGEKYVAVKTLNTMQELENAKSEPNKVAENAEISKQIKDKILAIDPNARFICDDYYGEYDLYEIKDNNLNKVCDNVNYIAINNDIIYAQNNILNDDVQIINKKIEEPKITMPVELHTNINDQTFDSIEAPIDMEEVKEDAPDLVNEEQKDAFDINEISDDLYSNNYINQEENEVNNTDKNFEIDKEEKTIFQKHEEDNSNKDKNVENEKSSEDIYRLVRSVKVKLEQSADDSKKIEELKKENSDFKDENSMLKDENNDLKNENNQLKNESIDLRHENSELKQENNELNTDNLELKDENNKLHDNNEKLNSKIEELDKENSELKRALKESDKKLEMVYKELIGFINNDGRYQENQSLKGPYVA